MTPEQKKEITIQLCEGLDAKIIIIRQGQQPLSEGDDVIVEGQLHLPVAPNSPELHPALRFSNRVNLLGENLERNWGVNKEGDRYRYKYDIYTECLWKKCFQSAEDDLRGEVEKLVNALEKRAKALKDAEA